MRADAPRENLPAGSNDVDFQSSENSTLDPRPKLTIVVGAPGEPFISAVSPSNAASEVPSDKPIEFTVTEGTLKVDPASVVLTVNGAKVARTLTRNTDSGEVKIAHAAAGRLPVDAKVTAKLVFSHGVAAAADHTRDQFRHQARNRAPLRYR